MPLALQAWARVCGFPRCGWRRGGGLEVYDRDNPRTAALYTDMLSCTAREFLVFCCWKTEGMAGQKCESDQEREQERQSILDLEP